MRAFNEFLRFVSCCIEIASIMSIKIIGKMIWMEIKFWNKLLSTIIARKIDNGINCTSLYEILYAQYNISSISILYWN